jgi:hypothetical protein
VGVRGGESKEASRVRIEVSLDGLAARAGERKVAERCIGDYAVR